MHTFQKRIGFNEDIEKVLRKVTESYKLGDYRSYEVIPIGYEDFNLILRTHKGRYFVKIFSSYRTQKGCDRYIQVIKEVVAHGVRHPKLLRVNNGFLCVIKAGGVTLRLFVTEFVNGKSLYEAGARVTGKEARFLIKQAALINNLRMKPGFIYDSWAISNFLKEFREKKRYLRTRERGVLESLAKRFTALSLRRLPHCLVHGDIHKANVLKDKKGKLFIIDFSVANYYPRIQELAVLLCSVLFNEKRPETIEQARRFALREYQKYIPLTKYELESFPLYCDVAHGMHVLQATYEQRRNGNISKENDYWLKLGRIGLGTT